MTGKERLLATLRGQVTDRVAVSPFVQEDFLSYYYPDENGVSRVEHGVQCAKELGFDVMTRDLTYTVPYFLRKSYENWQVVTEEKVEGDNFVKTITITTPEGVLTQVESAPYDEKIIEGIHLSTIKYFFDDEVDWQLFKKYVPAIDQEEIDGMKAKAINDNEVIGDTGIACPWGWGGVYNMASTYRNIEKLMMDPYLNPDFYMDYFEVLTAMMVENYRHLADTDFICLGIQGNIANSAMLSADFFETYVLPYEKQIVDVIHDQGKFALYHNCGHAKAFYEAYVKLGVDIWETVAPKPQGDNSLLEAAEAIDGRLILMGNLDQVDFLKRASVEEVKEMTVKTMEEGKRNSRFIFACSDFLEKGTPIENVEAMIETAVACC